MPTTSPRHIRTMDMLVIDNVFGMGDGYVLDSSTIRSRSSSPKSSESTWTNPTGP